MEGRKGGREEGRKGGRGRREDRIRGLIGFLQWWESFLS